MVRYEIEKMLFSGDVDVYELPDVWGRLMKEYLGVDVPNDKSGVLQDSHWSGGSFGYFPSYAIGTAYSAQIAHRMEQDLNIDSEITSGSLKGIVNWLEEHIYKYGSMYDPADLFFRCCGEKFDPKYFTDYLTKKFTKIYDLNQG